jgi:hypothetical protein
MAAKKGESRCENVLAGLDEMLSPGRGRGCKRRLMERKIDDCGELDWF